MKKYILIVLSAVGISSAGYVRAQTFTTYKDTVFATWSGPGSDNYNNPVTAPSSNPVVLSWKVIDTDFPADWLGSNLGICDNALCHNNGGSNTLWNPGLGQGTAWISSVYPTDGPDFHMTLNLGGCSSGTHWMTVNLKDTTAPYYNKSITFMITKTSVAVPNMNNTEDNIVLYPNPAKSELNVVYGAENSVKLIAVYNLIGKVVNVYKPLDNNSASLNIDSMPPGIYFMRLIDVHGAVIATRKFTKQ